MNSENELSSVRMNQSSKGVRAMAAPGVCDEWVAYHGGKEKSGALLGDCTMSSNTRAEGGGFINLKLPFHRREEKVNVHELQHQGMCSARRSQVYRAVYNSQGCHFRCGTSMQHADLQHLECALTAWKADSGWTKIACMHFGVVRRSERENTRPSAGERPGEGGVDISWIILT